MKKRRGSFDAVEKQAVAWLVRRDAGMSAGQRAEFDRWCAADPRHAAAVNEIEAVWARLDRPADAGQSETLRAELRVLERRDKRRWAAMGAATALAAAASVVGFLWVQRPSVHEPAAVAATNTARVTEPERRVLPDGSVVEFKPGTEIAVAFDDATRVVILKNGEAHFSVTKNPSRPFIVEAGTVRFRAVGTAFAVQLGRADVEVLVTEGRVSVTSADIASPGGGPPAGTTAGNTAAALPMIEAGQRTLIPLGSVVLAPPVVPVPVTELAERLSWRLPRLDFSETSIAEAIALLNRNNHLQLRTVDGAVAAMRITGVFRSDNVEGFVRALQSSLGVQAERRNGEILLRSAK